MSVVDGVIDCDSRGPAKGDQNLWTKKEYGDFELLVDWRIKEAPFVNRNARIILPDGTYKKDATGKEIAVTAPNTDSGVFLRGQHKSQVNIWCWSIGSGEVWGYRTDPRFSAEVRAGATPKTKADRPISQWNTFYIVMKGDRLTVKLNDQLVIDNTQLPGVPATGPIALQHHADRKDGDWGASLVQFRNIYVKELKYSGESPRLNRPVKPWPGFPLYAHPCGQWAKKIRGKTHYFGTDAEAALKLYQEQKDDLEAGRTPKTPDDYRLTVKDMVSLFIVDRRRPKAP